MKSTPQDSTIRNIEPHDGNGQAAQYSPPVTVDQILEERPKVHGTFAVGARWTQACKRLAQEMPSWRLMADDQRESIDMIIHKAQRILAGDPDHADHWDDIAGYALLVSKRLKAEQAKKQAEA